MNTLNDEMTEPHDSSYCFGCGQIMSGDFSDDEYCGSCADLYD